MSIRTLFVITSLERGGSEAQLVELVSRIHPAPVDAFVATVVGACDERLAGKLRAHGVPRVVLAPAARSSAGRWGAAALRLERLLRELGPDLVYAWGEYASLIAAPVARLRRVPLLVARRNSGNESVPALLDRAVRRVEARADLVTVNSPAAFEETIRHGVPRARLRLVPNGHDAASPSPPPAGGEVRLGYVAGLRPGKGHRELLRALPEVRARAPWRVELAGTGPLGAELRAEVRERGLAGRVRFLGMVDDIPRFWREHHACLLLSPREGSANALIEAGLAGRPLVASDVPGNRELVSPATGLLVRQGDAAAVARALGEIIDGPELRERLGRGAAQAMGRFGMDRMVEGHVHALTECRPPVLAA